MTLASMTGFAKAAGSAGAWRLTWELKAVNAKGLDTRLRLAPPFDAIEPDARVRNSCKNSPVEQSKQVLRRSEKPPLPKCMCAPGPRRNKNQTAPPIANEMI